MGIDHFLRLVKVSRTSKIRLQPLIFHPAFLATSQMQGQQSFLELSRYLMQLRSAT